MIASAASALPPWPAGLREGRPLLWINAQRRDDAPSRAMVAAAAAGLDAAAIDAARARLERSAPLLAALFPQLAPTGGAIGSPLVPAPALARVLGLGAGEGALWVKCDHALSVAGSVKARGAFHEVLEHVERIAADGGLPGSGAGDDRRLLAAAAARHVFAGHRLAVGSTGNLGLAVGLLGAALGLRTTVHMSADAKAWKKERLRAHGAEVVEHAGDYAQAVAGGRRAAAGDPQCHFVDDEGSSSLFLGYAAAAHELHAQLDAAAVRVGARHPLFVHLPCGVGGAPAGIAFGLAHALGPHVHCFFAEPTASPCFLLGMLAAPGAQPLPSVHDVGLDGRTEADGLRVARASGLAVEAMRPLLAGVFTVDDATLLRHVALAHDAGRLRLEPSAAAGFDGPRRLCATPAGRAWLTREGLDAALPQATHLVWTTGGQLVPDDEHAGFVARGRALAAVAR